jgi:hypothetical protein
LTDCSGWRLMTQCRACLPFFYVKHKGKKKNWNVPLNLANTKTCMKMKYVQPHCPLLSLTSPSWIFFSLYIGKIQFNGVESLAVSFSSTKKLRHHFRPGFLFFLWESLVVTYSAHRQFEIAYKIRKSEYSYYWYLKYLYVGNF